MTPETAANDVEMVDELRILHDEVRALQDAVDELREQLKYNFDNREPAEWQPVHRPIKTMSLDPAANGFRVGYELPAGMPVAEDRPTEDTPREEEGAPGAAKPDCSPVATPSSRATLAQTNGSCDAVIFDVHERTQRALFSDDSDDPAPSPTTNEAIETRPPNACAGAGVIRSEAVVAVESETAVLLKADSQNSSGPADDLEGAQAFTA